MLLAASASASASQLLVLLLLLLAELGWVSPGGSFFTTHYYEVGKHTLNISALFLLLSLTILFLIMRRRR